MTDSEQTLGCGCCEGIEAATPASVENLPGLSALAYRVGTHGRFKKSMVAALSGQPALSGLTTRKDDDPAIALIDGWATVLDVLSFYQERIANEGYLRTATERRSVLEMARRIGYELGPGVAAGTFLAFTLEDAPTAPTSATIAVGARAQSIPGQDERPQTYETVEEIEARLAWQTMKPQQTEHVDPDVGTQTVYLKGTALNLQPGDALLFIGQDRVDHPDSESWDLRRVDTATPDNDAKYTVVTLDHALSPATPFTNPTVYALRRRAALFGHNAPDWRTMPDEVKDDYLGDPPTTTDTEWPGFTLTAIADSDADTIYLDAVYAKIVQGSWVVLTASDEKEVYQVDAVAEDARANFTLTSKTTRLTLTGDVLDPFDDMVRETVVFAESEALEIAEQPITTLVRGNTIKLAEPVEGLTPDRLIIVSGIDSVTGEAASEVITLDKAEPEGAATLLTFITDLQKDYQRQSVELTANVARATHGETKTEVLGSGDGSKAFQKFVLKQKPLTYVSAATPTGIETTLKVRVNDVLWEEAPTFFELPPEKRAYVTRLADDGAVTVQFGDGITGARLPTGAENVTATYRVGIGLEGMLTAEQISLLMTRPLGVKKVINPLAPTGADNPEQLARARQNAPVTVLTLDRIVSLQDFEDFTSAFPGIGKAQATLLWNGERQFIHLTVAGAEGSEVPDSSDLYKNLIGAIDAARHPDEQVEMDTYEPLQFTLEARLLIDERYIEEKVQAAVQEALVAAFSFEKRAFGQGVTASEVLALIQKVEGVVAVDLELLDGLDPFSAPRVTAQIARWQETPDRIVKAAQLLLLDPDGVILKELTP